MKDAAKLEKKKNYLKVARFSLSLKIIIPGVVG